MAARRGRRTAAVSLFALLLLSTALHAAPISASDTFQGSLASSPLEGDRVLSEAQRLRSALEQTGFVSALQAVLDEGRVVVPGFPTLPEPSSQDLAEVGSLPSGLREPLAGLTAAVRASIDMVGLLPKAEVRRELLRLSRAVADPESWERGVELVRHLGTESDGGVIETGPRPLVPAAPSLESPAIARAQRALPVASLLIADALDRNLPKLTRWARSTPRQGGSVAGCDLVDATPLLCVGSGLDNVYEEDAALLVDVGGSNSYLNSAGGAPFLPPGGSDLIPVSVNVEVGTGDTLYEPGETGGLPQEVVATGGGGLGGLGILVDVGGNDEYSAVVRSDDFDAQLGLSIAAQGAGLGGIGLAFDLAGNDLYRAEAAPPRGASVGIYAQGAGGWRNPCGLTCQRMGSIGVLVDRGQGTDAYAIDGGTAELGLSAQSESDSPIVWAVGQGAAALGLGILADDGGVGTVHASAGARAIGSEDFTIETPPQPYARASVDAQGVGLEGAGYLIAGRGDTVYEAEVSGEGNTRGILIAQGAGYLGKGILQDLGGDDRYAARLDLHYQRAIVVDDDSCAPSCPSAQALVSAATCARSEVQTDCVAPTLVLAQGSGAVGEGRLDDGAGQDAYVAEGTHQLNVSLHDALTSPDAPPSLNVGGYKAPQFYAQGAADSGSGMLSDQTGTDAYSARILNAVHASAWSDHASDAPAVTAVSYGTVWANAQGSGEVGTLQDLGGSGDSFTADWDNPVTTVPDTGGTLQLGASMPRFQGSRYGRLVALGSDPSIFSSPSLPAGTEQVRGFGSWEERTGLGECPGYEDPECRHIDSANDGGHGEAPAASGVSPTLAFTLDTPQLVPAETTSVPVGARLLTPDGNPISGAVVHFSLLAGDPNYSVTQWWTSAVTGPQGVARADLPVRATDPEFSYGSILDPAFPRKLYATFDGARGLHPVHDIGDLAFW